MIRNFSWVLRGNILYAASQWVILVVLAKLGSPEMVGRFTLGFAITAPLVLFFNLQLRTVFATDTEGQHPFQDHIALRLLTNALALLTVTSIVFGIGYNLEVALVIVLIGLMKIFESSSDMLHGLMQKKERMDLIAVSQMLRGFCSAIVFSIALYLTRSLLAAVLALAILWLVLLLFLDSPNAVRLLTARGEQFSMSLLRPRWDRRQLQALAAQALPLGVVSMFISYYTSIPRYFLDAYHGEAVLGYFAAMAYLPVAGATVIEALGQSALPRLAKYYVSERSAYWNLVGKLAGAALALGFIGFGIAFFWGRPLLSLLYTPEYAQHMEAFLFIMAAGGLVYVCSVLGFGLTAARFFGVQVPILTGLVVTCALISWWLIPDYAENGAAWTLLICSTFWVLADTVALTFNSSHRPQQEPAMMIDPVRQF